MSSEKRIFITGGASGLGRALGERYARDGWRVCIGDVNETRGQETLPFLGAGAHYLRCDVTREEDLIAAAAWLEKNWGGVDIVVNNAGVAASGNIEESSIADWQWIVDINLLGVVRGCRAFVPMLRKQQSGHIVNIASMAGLVHPPQMSAYCATKAGVVALSETMQLELADDHVGVSVVCPAFFRTNLTETMRAANSHSAMLTQRLVGKAKHGAPEIAELVYKGVQRGDFHILTHNEGKLAWMMKRLLPFAIYQRVMAAGSRKMLRPRNV